MNTKVGLIGLSQTILADTFGIEFPSSFADAIDEYERLVSTWNDYASLVSSTDLKQGFAQHVADSLCLAPYINFYTDTRRSYLDIGSGAGFPAVPLKLLFPEMPVTLVERNGRKVAFLNKLVVSLPIPNVQIIQASYPIEFSPEPPFVITARAIERPKHFVDTLSTVMSAECIFLRQSGSHPCALPAALEGSSIQDAFDRESLRRGNLSRVSKTYRS